MLQQVHRLVGHSVARQRDRAPNRQIGPNAAEQSESIRGEVPRVGGRDGAKPDRRDEIGLLETSQDRAALRRLGDAEEHWEDFVGGEVVLIVAVLVVVEYERAGIFVEKKIHHRFAHALRLAAVSLPVVVLADDGAEHRRSFERVDRLGIDLRHGAVERVVRNDVPPRRDAVHVDAFCAAVDQPVLVALRQHVVGELYHEADPFAHPCVVQRRVVVVQHRD